MTKNVNEILDAMPPERQARIAARAASLKLQMASSGCVFCDLNLEPVKLRRRWVHHLPKKGKLVPCQAKNLKPAA